MNEYIITTKQLAALVAKCRVELVNADGTPICDPRKIAEVVDEPITLKELKPRFDDYRQAAEYWQRMYEEAFAERTCTREKRGVKRDGSPRLCCSLCGYGIGDKRFNYCPNCGAKVVGE